MTRTTILAEASSFAKLLRRAGTQIEQAAPRIRDRYGLTNAELRSILVAAWGLERAAKWKPIEPNEPMKLHIEVRSERTGSSIARPTKVFRAFVGGEPAGYLWFVWDHETQDQPVVHVGHVEVSPKFRRRGISTALHRAAAAWLASKGDFRLGSGMVVSEENALFWEKLEAMGIARASTDQTSRTTEWELIPGAVVPNMLLAKPPVARHRLRNTSQFRRLVGRQPTVADYEGVHTTSNRLIAAAYAMGSWSQVRATDPNDYPIIITLDVAGLEAHPDVDAMLRGGEAVADLLPEYRRMAGDGWTLADFVDDEDYREADAQLGEPPAAFIFEEVGFQLPAAIQSYADRSGEDGDDVLQRFLSTGQLPPEVLTELVEQKRYLVDFGLDRIVRIEAVKPWWDQVLLSFEDEEVPEHEARGYYVFTLDEWPFSNVGETMTVYENRDLASRATEEYHGTVSSTVQQAFPGLIPDEPPFPVEDET